jgi:hypothetical protein
MAFLGNWPSVVTGETKIFSINFGPETGLVPGDTILSCSASISVASGVDPNAAALIDGTPYINGLFVSQILSGGFVPLVVYRLMMKANMASGLVFINDGHIPCIPTIPTT